MDTAELLSTAVRSFSLYALMLIVVRLLGKRTVGNFSAFDFLVALMLGEVVDEIIYGDVTFVQGTVSILVIAAAKYVTSWLTYSNRTLNQMLEGKPTVLVEHGGISQKGLRREMMNESELHAALRLQGIDDIREVKLAVLEVDGIVSVIKEEWAEPVQKQDLVSDDKEQQDDKPPIDKQTDSDQALGRE